MKNLKTAITIFSVLIISSCQMTELDLFENPNNPVPNQADIDHVFHKIQLDFNAFLESTWDFTACLSRMDHHGGGFTYKDFYDPRDFDKTWDLAYAQIFPDIDLINQFAEEKEANNYAAIANILKAYTLITLVDLFGDVPYNQTLRAEEALYSPMHDGGEYVYLQAELLLEEAIKTLGEKHLLLPENDLFYDGDIPKWATLAKTILLKMALNTRLVDDQATEKINALLAEGDLIDDPSEDFQFDYSKVDFPESRHPLYVRMYDNPGDDAGFLSNYYMWLLRFEKIDADGDAIIDPRIRFYFYRQEQLENQHQFYPQCYDFVNPQTGIVPPSHFEAIDPNLPFCYIGDNYFGRDHLNGSGIPPNFFYRTVYGLYPMGGKFDDDSFSGVESNIPRGAQGQGINPILLSSYVDFMRAEAALVLGTNDDSRVLLEEAISESMDKIVSFRNLVPEDMNRRNDHIILHLPPVGVWFIDSMALKQVQPYLDYVLTQYDEAPSTDEKLNIIIKEYLIALWGNGIEAYNNMRRTCMPYKIQPAIEPSVSDFARSAWYPSIHVNRNENVMQKEHTQRVFWDLNEEGCLY